MMQAKKASFCSWSADSLYDSPLGKAAEHHNAQGHIPIEVGRKTHAALQALEYRQRSPTRYKKFFKLELDAG